jgi:spoIIIJ-associated protein
MAKLDKAVQIIENTLKLLDLSKDQLEVQPQADNITVQINLPEDQTGIYIGTHGDSLMSLQLVLGLMVSQRLGDWLPISVNVNDYRQKREEALTNLAENAAQKAISLNQEIIIPNLSSYERRIIHTHLQDNDKVVSESRGEGLNRQLFICPK